MSDPRQWLELGLAALPDATAQRVRLFRQLMAASGMLRNRLDRAMAPSGVTTQQAALLQFIAAQPLPPTLGQVAAAFSMTHQNAKQIAAALQRKGLLTIDIDPADRRARRLATTAAMRALWAGRDADDFGRIQAWTAALDDPQVAQLTALLQQLIGGIAALPADALTDALTDALPEPPEAPPGGPADPGTPG